MFPHWDTSLNFTSSSAAVPRLELPSLGFYFFPPFFSSHGETELKVDKRSVIL